MPTEIAVEQNKALVREFEERVNAAIWMRP